MFLYVQRIEKSIHVLRICIVDKGFAVADGKSLKACKGARTLETLGLIRR
jgi:hypothetical protein